MEEFRSEIKDIICNFEVVKSLIKSWNDTMKGKELDNALLDLNEEIDRIVTAICKLPLPKIEK